jgi:hypothetical protein
MRTSDNDRPTDDQPDEPVIGRIEPPGDDGDQAEPERPERPRRRRRRSLAIGCWLALLGGLLGGGIALRLGTGREEPPPETSAPTRAHAEYVAELIFSAAIKRPDKTPDILPAEAEAVYCFYEFSRLAPDAKLKGKWWREGKLIGELSPETHQLADKEHAAGWFAIPRPAGEAPSEQEAAFAAGIYEVEVTSPADPGFSVRASFVMLPRAAKILAGGGEPDRPLQIRDLQTASAVTDDGKPSEVRRSFPPDADRIYACFSYAGMPPGSTLSARWHYEGIELASARAEWAVQGSEGRGHAWLDPGEDQRLPEGGYHVTLHLGDDPEPLASLGFRVESPDQSRSGP